MGPWELPLRRDRISSVLGALGRGFDPSLAQWVKDLALLQLWLSSRLWPGSDPWPRSSICCGAARGEKKKKKWGYGSSHVAQQIKDLILSFLWCELDPWPGKYRQKKKKRL